MNEKDLPSSSDESDADFVPKDEEYNSDSGSEVTGSENSEDEDKTTKSRKRRKGGKRVSKKAKVNKNVEDEEEEECNESKEAEKNIDVDALWADFKKDVSNTESKKTAESSKSESKVSLPDEPKKNSESTESSDEKIPATVKPRNVPNFANKSRLGGLSKVLNQIGKKDKMSTLQKSQLDWNNFKKSEGIEEEIKSYNRGKDGYLDKQDFLQRTDLRQFEIEKDLRSARRKF